MILASLLQLMVERAASDLFVSAGCVPQLRIEGGTRRVGQQPLAAPTLAQALEEMTSERERRLYERRKELEFSYEAEGVGRFRVAAFQQQDRPAFVFRYVHPAVPRLDDLGLPPVLRELAVQRRGLILVVGPTGSGKSTTLAAMLQHRNASLPGHILTIEDPIEFHLASERAIVNQRELGRDTLSYRNAMQSALRSSPDVLMVGEVRDRLTMAAAMELAGSGHLTLSTLHANSAPQALDRIVNLYPPELHKQLKLDLAAYLRAVISQRLVLANDGRRIPAVEVMLNTPYVADLIGKGQFDKLTAAMEESRVEGMLDLDSALHALYRDGRVSQEEALSHAVSRPNLDARINFNG